MTLWYQTINTEPSKGGSISSGVTPLESSISFSIVRVLVVEGLKYVAFCFNTVYLFGVEMLHPYFSSVCSFGSYDLGRLMALPI